MPTSAGCGRTAHALALALLVLGLPTIAPAQAASSGGSKTLANANAKATPNPVRPKAIRDHRAVQSCGAWIKDPARCPRRPYRP